MRIYVDSSALVKRVLDEPEKPAVVSRLRQLIADDDVVISSSISRVEVTRVIRSRLDAEPPRSIVDFTDIALSHVVECPITDQVVDLAARYGPRTLRSLDAIHLATAQLYGADFVWTYDRLMSRSADELGFRTMHPGADSFDA